MASSWVVAICIVIVGIVAVVLESIWIENPSTVMAITSTVSGLVFAAWASFATWNQINHAFRVPRFTREQEMSSRDRQRLIQRVIELRVHQELSSRLGLASHAVSQTLRVRPDLVTRNILTSNPPTSLLEAMDRSFGPLLVLGSPGSGKTTALLSLLSQLVSKAQQNSDEPIPELFLLGSWDGTDMLTWLGKEFSQRHGYGRDVKHWIAGGDLAILLDGFDELDPARRVACQSAITNFIEVCGSVPFVMTSRIDGVPPSHVLTGFSAAVELLPLNSEQVTEYLGYISRDFERLARRIAGDEELVDLRDLLSNPLILSIAAQSFSQDPEGLLASFVSGRERGFGVAQLWWNYFVDAYRNSKGDFHKEWNLIDCHFWATQLAGSRFLSMEKHQPGNESWINSERITPARIVPNEDSSRLRRWVTSITLTASSLALVSHFGFHNSLPWLVAGLAGLLSSVAFQLASLLIFAMMLMNIPLGRVARILILLASGIFALLPIIIIVILFWRFHGLVLIPIAAITWCATAYDFEVEEPRSWQKFAGIIFLIEFSLAPLVSLFFDHNIILIYVSTSTLLLLSAISIRTSARPWEFCNLSRSADPLKVALSKATRRGAIAALIGLLFSAFVLTNVIENIEPMTIISVAIVVGLAAGLSMGLAWTVSARMQRVSPRLNAKETGPSIVEFLEWCADARILVRVGSSFLWFHREPQLYFLRSPGSPNLSVKIEEVLSNYQTDIDSYTMWNYLDCVNRFLAGRNEKISESMLRQVESCRDELRQNLSSL